MNVSPERLREASEQVTGRREPPTFSFEIDDAAAVNSSASHARLRLACDYVEARLTEHISLTRLAAEVGISKYYLVRQFTEAFGLPPHSYQFACESPGRTGAEIRFIG